MNDHYNAIALASNIGDDSVGKVVVKSGTIDTLRSCSIDSTVCIPRVEVLSQCCTVTDCLFLKCLKWRDDVAGGITARAATDNGCPVWRDWREWRAYA